MLRLTAIILLLLAPSIAQAASGSYAATAGSGLTFAADNDASSHLVAEVGLCQAAAGTSGTCGAVKAASTAAVAGDPSIVMQLSPNSLGGASGTPLFASITNSSIAVTGTFWQTTQPVSLASLPAYTNSSTVTIGKVDNLGNAGAIIDFAGQNATVPANAWLVGCGFNTSPTTISSGNASPLGCDNKDNLLVNLNAGVGTAAGNGLFVTPATSAIFEVSPTTAANTSSNPFFSELSDGTHTNTIKAASTQSVAGDTSQVVQINPNQPNLTIALNVSAAPTTATAWGVFTNGSTSSGSSGVLGMAAVTTAAPTYTNAQNAWLSQTTGGGLRADIASVVGTAASTAASGVLKVGIVGNAGSSVDSAAGSAATNAVNVQGITSMTPLLTNPGTAANWGVVTQGSTTSGQSGQPAMAAATTSPVSATNAQTGFETMDLNSLLRVTNLMSCNKVINVAQAASTDVHTFTGFGYICGGVLVSATAQSIGVDEGTGTTCETSGTALIGVSSTAAATPQISIAANGGFVIPPGLRTQVSADHLCVLQGSTGEVAGTIYYADLTN